MFTYQERDEISVVRRQRVIRATCAIIVVYVIVITGMVFFNKNATHQDMAYINTQLDKIPFITQLLLLHNGTKKEKVRLQKEIINPYEKMSTYSDEAPQNITQGTEDGT